ncbi:hypothetical protein [Pelagicoccus sp. SDUM812005]|uniref:hypothetical protein n=1 Tax=Pelagicoccus sp. SDUM812005 TaxID=3041257 RepID=UPI00280F17C5|nr:hypothetical protein [Pelagicoccus sp. SDUM812005]MDQ8182648.1 hypothetical protein [Pelagicoccus sp. SDUM812005]
MKPARTSLAPLLLLLLLFATPLQATITVTGDERIMTMPYRLGIDSLGTVEERTVAVANNDLDFEKSASGTNTSGFPWSASISGKMSAEYQQRQSPSGRRLLIRGRSTSEYYATSEGALDDGSRPEAEIDAEQDTTSHLGTNLIIIRFNLERAADFTLNFDHDTTLSSSSAELLLKNGPTSTVTTNFNAKLPITVSSTLEAGDYELHVGVSHYTSYASSGSWPSVTASYQLDIHYTDQPEVDDPTSPETPPGGFTNDLVFTEFTDSEKLVVSNISLLSETDLGDGTTRLQFSVDLQNTSACFWQRAEVLAVAESEGAPSLTATRDAYFGNLDPDSSNAPAEDEFIEVVVANADSESVKASILDGSRLQTNGRELVSFTNPIVVVDYGMVDKLLSYGPNSITFEMLPNVSVGDIIYSEPSYYVPPTVQINETGFFYQGFDSALPFLVKSIEQSEESTGTFLVNGEQINLFEYTLHGTLETSYARSGVDTTGPIGVTSPDYYTHPIHFNRIPMSDTIEASGSFAIRPNDLGVKAEFESGLLRALIVEGKLNIDANFLIEISGSAESEGSAAENRKTLAEVPLIVIVLPSGLIFKPELSFEVGVSAQAQAGLSLPFETGLEVTFKGGWDRGEAVYDCQATPVPTRISRPRIHEDSGVGIEIDALTEVAFKIYPPSAPVEVGPTFGAALNTEFSLTPLADPAWQIEADLELRGGVELEILEIISFIDAEKTLLTLPVVELDSGGPLAAANPSSEVVLPDNPGLRPLEGASTRWIRALQPLSNTSGTTDMFAVSLAGTDHFVAGGSTTTNGEIVSYTSTGELRWALKATTLRPISAVAEPDGSFTVLSQRSSSVQLTNIDGDGNQIWQKSHKLSGYYTYDNMSLARGESESGAAEYFVLGRSIFGAPFNKHATVTKLDANGIPQWSRVYTTSPDEQHFEPNEIIVTQDGNLALAGTTYANIEIPNGGDLISENPNLTYNPFVLKLDSETGDVLWSTVIGTGRIAEIHTLAEDDEGNLYLGGGVLLVVYDTIPSNLLCKLSPDGQYIDSILLGHEQPDIGTEAEVTLSGKLPQGGQSLKDVTYDMVWADGALWIGGQIGFFNSGLGYLNGSSAFTARVSKNLGVSRFSIHAGSAGDHIRALADGGDGLFAYGGSSSFLPWPEGAASEDDAGPFHRTASMIPWEGLARFHPASGAARGADAAEPTSGSFFVYPRQVATSSLPDFSVRQESLFEGGDEVRTGAGSLSYTITELSFEETTDVAGPTPIAPLQHFAMEFFPEEKAEDLDSFLAWSQIDSDADPDRDAYGAALEWLMGADPFSHDYGLLSIQPTADLPAGSFDITFPRRKQLSDGALALFSSENLLEWEEVSDATYQAGELDDFRDLITVPIEFEPDSEKRFFSIQIPTTTPATIE